MKKTAVVLLLLICTMFTLCACQREADMVEDMVSTVFSENDKDNNNSAMNNNNNTNNGNNGTVTDGDGIIGNEENGTINRNATDRNSDNVM